MVLSACFTRRLFRCWNHRKANATISRTIQNPSSTAPGIELIRVAFLSVARTCGAHGTLHHAHLGLGIAVTLITARWIMAIGCEVSLIFVGFGNETLVEFNPAFARYLENDDRAEKTMELVKRTGSLANCAEIAPELKRLFAPALEVPAGAACAHPGSIPKTRRQCGFQDCQSAGGCPGGAGCRRLLTGAQARMQRRNNISL